MGIWLDLRHAIRGLRRWPVSAGVALLTLAVGIAANAVLFSVLDAVVLRPLPVEDPDRLVKLIQVDVESRGRYGVTYHNYLYWRERGSSFVGLAILQPATPGLAGSERVERLRGYRVSAGYFEVLGATPVLGRPPFFGAGADARRQAQVVISDRLWRDRFGADAEVVGRVVTLDGEPHEIVGVMPPGSPLATLGWEDVWLPLDVDEARALAEPLYGGFTVLGRLRFGVPLEEAQRELDTVAAGLAIELPATNRGWGVELRRASEWMLGDADTTLLVLAAAVGAVLLIACANVSNLLVSRVVGLRDELRTRSALGGTRSRLLQLVLVESTLLGLAAGALGSVLAVAGIKALEANVSWSAPRFAEAAIDLRALGLVVAVSIGVGLACGSLVAWRLVGRGDAGAAGSRVVGGDSGVRGALVAAELAMALVVVSAAGLTLESLRRVEDVDPGFEPNGLLTLHLELPDLGEEAGLPRLAAMRELSGRIEALPGVAQVALSDTQLPLDGDRETFEFFLADGPREPGSEIRALAGIVSGGYFETLGIPLLRGRVFSRDETWEGSGAVVVNEELVRRLWPGGDGVGRQIVFKNGEVGRVVGVVGNVHQSSLEVSPGIELFVPWGENVSRQQTLALRVSGRPGSYEKALQHEIRQQFPGAAVFDVREGRDLVAGSLADRRALTLLLSLFGAISLMLAAAGVFAVAAAAAAARAREVGVRVALGAEPAGIAVRMVGLSMKPVLVGLGAGSVLSVVLGRLWRSRLYAVQPWEPRLLLLSCVVLGLVALLASWLPARRASRVDPRVVLRSE